VGWSSAVSLTRGRADREVRVVVGIGSNNQTINFIIDKRCRPQYKFPRTINFLMDQPGGSVGKEKVTPSDGRRVAAHASALGKETRDRG